MRQSRSRKPLRREFRHFIFSILADGDTYSGRWLRDEFSVDASRIHLRSFLGRNFRTHGNRQEKRNPDGMHHLKATLTKIVSNRDDKERQAEITRLYPAKYRGEDVAIPSDEEDGQQNQPHPAQIQIYFDITVVRLVYSLSD